MATLAPALERHDLRLILAFPALARWAVAPTIVLFIEAAEVTVLVVAVPHV